MCAVVFDMSPLESHTMRGKSGPTGTYLVRGAKPRSFRIRGRGV
jgi:hypothetical protein